MSSIKFSIIIPVYNVEKYLNECVDSVINQTYKNMEIILVDDGSTDNSPRICDSYAEKDNRIRVIHKENGGLSSARNAGIRNMTGNYVLFIDSDDFWDSNRVIEDISNIVGKKNADIVCFGYKEYYESKNEYKSVIDAGGISIDNASMCDALSKLLSAGIYTSSACSKAIRSEIILKNNLYFVENITSEDIDWSARLLLKSHCFAVYNNDFYVYRQREDSITHTIKFENLQMLSDNIVRCIGFADHVSDESLKSIYLNYVAYQYITFLNASLFCEKDKRIKPLVQKMKKYKYLLKYNLNRKVKLVYTANKFLGFNVMYKLLKLYLKR